MADRPIDCSQPTLGTSVICLHISTSTNSHSSPQKIQTDQNMLPDSTGNWASLAKADLVSRPNESAPRDITVSSPVGKNAKTTEIIRVSPKPKSSKPVWMETVQIHVHVHVLSKDKGFSDEASQIIMAPQASSVLQLYAGKWRVFETWCKSKELDPFVSSMGFVFCFVLFG